MDPASENAKFPEGTVPISNSRFCDETPVGTVPIRKTPVALACAAPINNSRFCDETPVGILRVACAAPISNPRFFKVPAEQRRANNEVFDPILFSFGPYHAGAACLTDGEHLKRLVATDLIGQLEENDCLRRLEDRIKQHEPQLRDLYIQMSEAQRRQKGRVHPVGLAELLALDSILIVSTALPKVPYRCFIESMLLKDGLLLENQVPIFVLKYALESLPTANVSFSDVLQRYYNEANPFPTFKLTEREVNDQASLSYNVSSWDVLQRYYNEANPFPTFKSTEREVNDQASLLGFVYDHLAENNGQYIQAGQSSHRNHNENHDDPVLPTASHLVRCGFKFSPSTLCSFRGIEFNKKKMELCLPKIRVGDFTPRILHNLLAYEATIRDSSEERFPVISYVYIMDRLIDTEEDVQILVDAGIIQNLLGSHQELASSWNRLCTSVSFSLTRADRETIRQVEKLSKKLLRKWMAAFKEKYWQKQPWLLISIIAAATLLALGLLQTIYTIKGTLRHQ